MKLKSLPANGDTVTPKQARLPLKCVPANALVMFFMYAMVTSFLCVNTISTFAQTPAVPVDRLIATGATLIAGDVTFGNFHLTPVPAFSNLPVPDGPGNVAASTLVNADGSVSLIFTMIDPATGIATPASGAALLQSIAYDVTVTNPAVLLGSVDQRFGAATNFGFNTLSYRQPSAPFSQLSVPFGQAAGLTGFFLGGAINDTTLFYDVIAGQAKLADGTIIAPTTHFGIQLPNTVCFGTTDPVTFIYTPPASCAIPLPGGNRSSLGLESSFGILNSPDAHGVPISPTLAFDGVAVTFTVVPATNVVTAPPVVLQSFAVDAGGGALSLARFVDAGGISRPAFAPAGGISVALTTSNPAALPLPPSIIMPQGAEETVFSFADPAIDVLTAVTATATYNGVTLTKDVLISPTVPLNIAFLRAGSLGKPLPINVVVTLNRNNFSPAVITLTSSNPAVAPVPASLTVPALSGGSALVAIPYPIVPVDTPLQFTATFNGITQATNTTVPKTVDTVKVAKAELVVKNGSLKVEATGTVPTAVLTLTNATTGAVIGTMTNTGLSAGGAKYSFVGIVPGVTSLLLTSNFSGSSTAAVAQK